jgi:glycosidase
VTQERPIHQEDRGAFEEARLPMKWAGEQDRELHGFFRKLIHLRQENPFLLHGERRVVHLEVLSNTYAYLWESGRSRALVVLNMSQEPRTITVQCSFPGGAQDRLNDYPVSVRDGVLEVQLPPKSGAFVQ